ncbi:MAG: dTMP kinase [Verrucomicrobia bacterium]|nr:dTMP kinase [Verrucomicrobiota bacterium]
MKPLPTPGILVAFEGIDGAGKTTQVGLVSSHLMDEELAVVTSKEPTNGVWGSKLRESAQTGRLDPKQELELFLLDRRSHVDTLINPALKRGEIVLLDRYYFSTAAYQGIHGGASPAEILRLNEEFAPEPDLLVILDLPAELGIERIGGRGDQANLFEQVADLSRCREIFRGFKEAKPYVMFLDATEDPNRLARRIANQILRIIPQRIADAPNLTIPEKLAAIQSALGSSNVIQDV